MIHSLYTIGLRYSQYKRICDSSNKGIISESAFESHYNLYCSVTEDLAKESIIDAINEEVTTEVLKA